MRSDKSGDRKERENRSRLSNGGGIEQRSKVHEDFLFVVYEDGAVCSYIIEGPDGGINLLDIDLSCCIGPGEEEEAQDSSMGSSARAKAPTTGGCAPFPSMRALLVLNSKGAVFGFDPQQGNIAARLLHFLGFWESLLYDKLGRRCPFECLFRGIESLNEYYGVSDVTSSSSDISDPILAGQKSGDAGDAGVSAHHRQGPVKCGVTVVLMYPNVSVRFIAFQGVFSDFAADSGIVAVVPAFDRSLLVVGNNASTGNACVYALHEKAITEEVSMLQQKGMYESAVEVAMRENLPVMPYLTQLYTKYGMSLVENNQIDDALRVLLKAAADLRLPIQTSTVIEAFRARHRVPAITTFLLRLHEAEAIKRGPNGEKLRPITLYKEHTYMLMKCLCRLGDYRGLERLVELLTRKDCDLPVDISAVIDILLTGGYPKLASRLALAWGGEGTTASAAELYVGTCLEADDGDVKREAAIEYLKGLIDRGQDAAVIAVLTSSRGIGRSLMHANAEGMMPLLETMLERHPVLKDEETTSHLASSNGDSDSDNLSVPIEMALSKLLPPTEACRQRLRYQRTIRLLLQAAANMLLDHLSRKSRSCNANETSLLPPLCLELCLRSGLQRKDEESRERMVDILFDRNLGVNAPTMADACFQFAWVDGITALIESSYTKPEQTKALARELFDTADPSDLWPNSYVKICDAVSAAGDGRKKHTTLEDSTRRLWLQALRKLRRRPVKEDPRERSATLQAMNEIIGTLTRYCGGSAAVTSEVLDALTLDPSVEGDDGTMVDMGTLKPMIRVLLKNTSQKCSTSLDNLQQDKEELQRMRQEVESLRTTARVFNGREGGGSPKCAECGQRMDLPAVHFMCMHSFHQLCLSSDNSDEEYKCPLCQPEALYKETTRMQREESVKDPETLSTLYKAIGASPEDFSIIADYLGRGLFHTSTDS
ncbi:Vacuolar protein sorting-associated protein 11 [Perkinsus chesapeaki]|uniref:Vacuolar protein sorting-associated protein 11 n=1 Tax=Perkinsus chesapeaki TaxID=330153 RepID=A0A7J6MEM3_PERCH|nr:Vacuolar protein sorting-associated protein 11 [Perkinsus chesapeaki]